MPSQPGWRAFGAAAAVAVAVTLLFALWVDREWGGADATLWMVDLVSLAAPLAAAGACWHRARRDEGHRRQAWRLVAIGCLSWALGQVVWAWYELARGLEVPNPSLADLGYLAFIPAMAAALVMAVAGTVAAVSRIRTLLDGAILAGSILFLGWAGGFGSEFQAGEGTLIARSVNLVYPVGDVALLVLAAYGLYRAHPGGRLPVLLQTAGIFAIFNADNQFLDENLAGTYATGSILDAGWVAGFLLFGLSALVPGTPAAPEFTRLRQSGSLVIYIPLAAAIATAAAIEVTRGSLEPFLFWNALVVVVLVVARGSLVFAENVSLTQQVEEAYARLKVLEAQRSMLLRTVTHDLQNPLSPIQIQLHLLAKTDPTPAQRRGLDIIGRSAEQMKRLTDDLLDLARIEDARLNLDRRRLDLKELLETQAASYADAAQSRGLRLRLDVSAALPVQADSGRLAQVLTNLLSNALKFTPPGGEITVSGTREAAFAIVRVHDTGRGLTAEEVGRLFQPFTQVHAKGEVAERGNGLGLFISKGLVEAHGGTIGVRSEGLGKGSEFWFRIPLQNDAPRP